MPWVVVFFNLHRDGKAWFDGYKVFPMMSEAEKESISQGLKPDALWPCKCPD
jgi:hypothetical protein